MRALAATWSEGRSAAWLCEIVSSVKREGSHNKFKLNTSTKKQTPESRMTKTSNVVILVLLFLVLCCVDAAAKKKKGGAKKGLSAKDEDAIVLCHVCRYGMNVCHLCSPPTPFIYDCRCLPKKCTPNRAKSQLLTSLKNSARLTISGQLIIHLQPQ